MVIFLTVNVDAISHGMSNFAVPLNVSSSLLTEVTNLFCGYYDSYMLQCKINNGFCFEHYVLYLRLQQDNPVENLISKQGAVDLDNHVQYLDEGADAEHENGKQKETDIWGSEFGRREE
ncbi:Hypothetical predicted protein [Podarcis lilfordi]|uniref:Uncharacterized protein n=1 Tax=Podarcis lilfordi TaxID=74358 RepID=A0AA35QPM4_9SAUR|nr:Hypothetical predicted protein [Podarcis lilfordi]